MGLTIASRLRRGGYGAVAAPLTTVPTDMQAPPMPISVTVTPEVGQIRRSWEQVSDLTDGVTAGSGIDKYQIELNSVVSDVAKPSGQTNVLNRGTLANIGGFSPAPTAVYNGTSLTLTAAGAGIDGTSDECAFVWVDRTDDFMMALDVATFSGPGGVNPWAESGIMVRGGLGANEVYFAIYQFLQDGQWGIQAKSRTSTNGDSHSVALHYGDFTRRKVLLKREGIYLKIGHTDAAGAWIDLAAPIEATWLPSAVKVGNFLTSFTASQVVTSRHDNIVMTNGVRLEHVQVTATSNRISRVRAVDLAGNVSPWTDFVTASPLVDPLPGAVYKFNPGHYLWFTPSTSDGVSGFRFDLSTKLNEILAFIDTLADKPQIKGIQLVAFWKTLEWDGRGDYTHGFPAMDAILQRLNLYGKKLFITFQTVVFGGYGNIYDIFPAYVVDSPSLGTTNLVNYSLISQNPSNPSNPGYNQGETARSWEQATMDDIIRVSKAYADRYDGHPAFECLTFGETSLQVLSSPPTPGVDYSPTFSNEAIYTQLARAIPAVRTDWPHTMLRLGTNDFPENRMVDLFQLLKLHRWGAGGPDIYPRDITQGNRVYMGRDNTGAIVYEVLQGVIPWMIECQTQSFTGIFTMPQLYDAETLGYLPSQPNGNGSFFMPATKPTHMIWLVNRDVGPDSMRWFISGSNTVAGGEQTFLLAHPNVYDQVTQPVPRPSRIP